MPTSVIINDNLPRTQAVAIGGQTVYSTNWTANYYTDVAVYSRAAGVAANDATQILAQNLYTVAFIGDEQTVQVTLVNPSTLGDNVTISRMTPAARMNLYTNTNFTPSMLNNDFGILTLVDQQAQMFDEQITPRYNISDIVQPLIDTILPVLPANSAWVKNSANTAIISIVPVTLAQLASYTPPSGASLIGLQNQSNVNNKTVQDLANSTVITQHNEGVWQNGQALDSLTNGILRNSGGVLQQSPGLTSIDTLVTAADEMIYLTAANTYATTQLTALGRTLLSDTTSAQMRLTLGLQIGTDVQAWNAKLQSISSVVFAPNQIALFLNSSTVAALDFSPLAQTLVGDTSTATMQATLGITPLGTTLLANVNAAGMRSTLGLVIGTDVQAYNDNLQSISGLGSAANKMLYTTGLHTWAESDISAYSRTILPLADLAAWQLALGIPGGGGAYFAIANNLSEGVPATMRTNLGLVIGTNVQAYDATLQSLSALGTAADKIAYTTGVDTWAETGISALGRTLIDDMTQADMNTTIGSVPLAGGTMTGALYLSGSPLLGSQAATKDYVDSVAINVQIACKLSTTGNLAGYVYANGAAGVGATLTAGGVGVLIVDGVATVLNDRILVQFQTAQEQNGAYYVSTQGTAGIAAILTRATDYNTAGQMQAGDQFSVVAGTLYAASIWMMSQTAPITVGTTAITFQQVAGLGALLKANNLSDLPSAATARTNLGLAIGTNVQAYDATLQSLSALGTAADKIAYTTGVDTWAETGISATGRTLIAGADATAMRVTLGLVIGTNVQAWSSKLDSLAAPTYALGDLIYGSGANTVTNLAGNTLATKKYLSQTGTGAVSAAPIWATIAGSDVTGAALTKSDDTNVTLTLGGSASTALLNAASLTLGWTGQLGLSRGGSNAALTASNGGIIYSTASAMAVLAGTATARQMLQSSASTTPAWSSTTWPATSTINQLLYSSAANVIGGLATANSGVLVTDNFGVPSIATTLPSGLSIPKPIITGVVNGNPAGAGQVGEVIQSVIPYASGVACVNGTAKNVTSILLTPGNWRVTGNGLMKASIGLSGAYVWISQASATINDPSAYNAYYDASGTATQVGLSAQTFFVYATINTTVYLSVLSAFGSGTVTACGGIYAERFM